MLSVLLLSAVLAAAPGDTATYPLREIVVTGTRSPDSLSRIPAAVTVVQKSTFEDTKNNSLKDPLTGIPGVFAQSRAGSQDVRITIRGYGARGNGERSNVGSMRGIRILTDGIPITEPDGRTSLDLVDLGATHRVEVARSNSSVLYGNASGGVVNLRTDLGFNRPFTEVLERAGDFGYHREQFITGFAMGRARGQFSLYNSTFDGWREHSSGSSTQGQLRLGIPIDAVSRLGLAVDGVTNINRFPGALTQTEFDTDPQMADPAMVSRDERRRNRVGRIGLTFDRELTPAQDLALTAFVEPKALQRSERSRFRDFTRVHTGGSGQWSGHRALGKDAVGTLSVGADDAFQDGSIMFYNLNPDGSRSTTVRANKREAANAFGGFVQGEVRWGERWSASLAARYDNLWYISEDRVDPTLNDQTHFTHVTPKGTLAYMLGNHTLYANLGGGVEAPAFNEIDPGPPFDTQTSLNPFLDPMISSEYEVGGRGQLPLPAGLTGATYDVALYYLEVTNDLVPLNGGAYFTSAGKTRREGLEAGLRWQALQWAALRGSLTLTDNTFLDYQDTTASAPKDFDGNDVPGLPTVLFEGGADLASRVGLSGSINVRALNGYYADDANTLGTVPYTAVDMSVAYQRTMGNLRWRLSVGGENVFDKKYVESVFTPTPADIRWLEPGLPARWNAGLTVHFE